MLSSDSLFRLYYDSRGALNAVNHVDSGALAWAVGHGSYSHEYGQQWQAGIQTGLYDIGDRPDLATPEPRLRAERGHWGDFRIAMMSDSDYNQIALTVRYIPGYELLHERLENIALMEDVQVDIFILLWNSFVDAYRTSKGGEAIADSTLQRWSEILEQTGLIMEFSFQMTDPGKAHLVAVPD